jgi:hypothetical protein
MSNIQTYIEKFKQLSDKGKSLDVSKIYPLSFSAINSGLMCPAKINYSRISNQPAEEMLDDTVVNIGTFNHRVAQLCIENTFLLSRIEDEMEFDVFWAKNARGLTRGELMLAQAYRDDLESLLGKVLRILNKYKLDAFVEPTWGISVNGNKFTPHIARNKKFVVCRLDLVGLNEYRSSGLVLDYKTHCKTKQNQDELRKQLLLYVVAAKLKYPLLKNMTAGAAYVDGAELDVSFTVNGDAEFFTLFDEFIAWIESFYAIWDDILNCVTKKNSKCKYCNYVYLCNLK